MSLRDEEVVRIKAELGYNITGVGADVYIAYTAVFDRAVQPYLIDPSTTSSTAVTAVAGGASVALTLASNPPSLSSTQSNAFVVGSKVVVDVGAAQETSIITSLNGLSATMVLANAHSGTYPVVLQGAEQFIRDILTRIDAIQAEMLNVAPKTAGLQALVGELEFVSGGSSRGRPGRNKFEELLFQRTIARRDLAAAIGVPYLADVRGRSGGQLTELY